MSFSRLMLFLLIFSTSLFAAKKDGVEMPDKIQIDGQKLVLNGLGIRKATFFNVHVYVGGLYLEKKAQKAESFLDTKSLKHIKMHFVRDVDREDVVGGWNEAFKDAVPKAKRQKISEKINRLNEHMPNMKKGETMEFTFYPKKVRFRIGDGKPQVIKGKPFSRSLLSVWFINAKDQGLKKGLLGKLNE